MNITDIRRALGEPLHEFGEVQVWLAPTDYGKGGFGGHTDEAKFNVRIVVGSTTDPGVEEKIDELFNLVPEKLEEDRTRGGVLADLSVLACTGHRLYSLGPDAPVRIGAEWSVKIVAND